MRRTALLTAIAALGLAVQAAPSAHAATPTWAPLATATIRPGMQISSAGGYCTSNFVFTDAAGDVLIGTAGHCEGGDKTTAGTCAYGSAPLGTQATFLKDADYVGAKAIVGLSQTVGTGTLVYNSRLADGLAGQTDPTICDQNDFALIKVDAPYKGQVNPTVPFWGGPNGLTSSQRVQGDLVYGYGNTPLRGGFTQLSPKAGVVYSTDTWRDNVVLATPGIPGDSGSGLLDKSGAAAGIASVLEFVPPAGNGFGNLAPALAYAQRYSGIAGLRLVSGTTGFNALGGVG